MENRWWQEHSLLILVLILALGLRLPQLTGSFWLDEAAQALESTRPWSQQLQLTADFQPPLLHLITAVTSRISHREWWLRTWGALVPGLISIVGTYLIGQRLKNKKVGLLSALLLTTSSFHIFYSQELRPYALPMMWAVLSWLLLLKATNFSQDNNKQYNDADQPNAKTQQNWWLFTLFSLLGFYSSYLYPFLWLGQASWLIWEKRENWRQLVVSATLTILGFAPWLPSFLKQLEAGRTVKTKLPGWAQVVSIPQLKALPLVFGKFLYGTTNLELNLFFLFATALTGFLVLHLLSQLKSQLKKNLVLQQLTIIGVWLLFPTITAWLISFIIPVVRPKRLLMVLPAFYLAFSYLIALTKDKLGQKIGTSLLILLLSFNLLGFWQYSFNPRQQRENWRALHQEVSHRYPPSDSILLFSFPEPFAPWRWYDQGNYPTLSTGQLKLKAGQELTHQIKAVAEYRYVLLFDYLRDLTDPQDQLRTELWALGFREIKALNYPGIGLVRVFSQNKIMAHDEVITHSFN